MSIATYELSEEIDQEVKEANQTLIRTRIHAAKMAAHLTGAGQVKRYMHDTDVLTELKRQLQEFDAKTKKWKSQR